MSQTSTALIAIGANLPLATASVDETLRMAITILHNQSAITITACSRLWKTLAVPAGSGPDFVNAAARIQTDLSADKLLEELHRIEARFGRDRNTGRWSARVLDLDLLAYDDQILPDKATWQHWLNLSPDQQAVMAPERLILPHPRLQDRGFVLAPLADIVPGWLHPATSLSVAHMLAALPQEAITGIKPYD